MTYTPPKIQYPSMVQHLTPELTEIVGDGDLQNLVQLLSNETRWM